MSLRDTREVVRLLKYHFDRDRNAKGQLRITKKLRSIYRLGIRRRWFIGGALGATLGEALYHAYHEDRISHEELIDLFRERFETPGSSCARYLSLVQRTSPYREHRGSYRNNRSRRR
jgi:hypothetical protein